MNGKDLDDVWRSISKTREELTEAKTHLQDHVINCKQINESINKKVNYLFILAVSILLSVIGGMWQILTKVSSPYVEFL